MTCRGSADLAVAGGAQAATSTATTPQYAKCIMVLVECGALSVLTVQGHDGD